MILDCYVLYGPINVKPAGGWGGGGAGCGGGVGLSRGGGFDCPGVGHLTDLVVLGEGIFESFFGRRGDV